MARVRVALTLLVGVWMAVAGPVEAQSNDEMGDEAGVRAAVELYLQSHATGDGQYVSRAFYPDLTMYFIREGELRSRSAEEYIAGFSGQPSPQESERRRWIEMVDVTGTAAVAKVVLDYPAVRITDYFTLLKVDGSWKIMNKIFHTAPK